MYTSQPALSPFLNGLENLLGFVIFNRTSQGISPTKRGKRYLELVSDILTEYDSRFSAFLSEDCDMPTIRLGIADQRASVVFPYILRSAEEQTNRCNIRLTDTYNGHQELLNALEQGEEDVVCTSFYGQEKKTFKKYHWFDLCSEELLLAIPKGHRLFDNGEKLRTKRRSMELQALQNETFVLCSQRRSLGKFVDQLFQQYGFMPKVAHRSNNMTTLFRTSLSSNSLTIVTEGYWNNSENNQDFCCVSIGEKGFSWKQVALSLEPPSPSLMNFFPVLREAFAASLQTKPNE